MSGNQTTGFTCQTYIHATVQIGSLTIPTIFVVWSAAELGVFVLFLSLLLLLRWRAHSGSNTAALTNILPMYWNILYAACFHAFVRFAAVFTDANNVPPALPLIVQAVSLGLRACIIDGTALFFMGEYYGAQSYRNSWKWSGAWGFIQAICWIIVAVFSIGKSTGIGYSVVDTLKKDGPTIFTLIISLIPMIVVTTVWLGDRIEFIRRVFRLREHDIRPRAVFYYYSVYLYILDGTLAISAILQLIDGGGVDCYVFWNLSNLAVLIFPFVIYICCWKDSLFLCMLDEDSHHYSNKDAQHYMVLDDENSIVRFLKHHGAVFLDFRLLRNMEHLAQGGFGTVAVGRYMGMQVAVKSISCFDMMREDVLKCCKESSLMAHLDHPNIARFIGVCVKPPDILLVSKYYANGDLYTYLRKNHDSIYFSDTLRMANDVANGMLYLHSRIPPVLWRDAKTHNCLVDVDHRVVLADFGESKELWKLKVNVRPRKQTNSARQRPSSTMSNGGSVHARLHSVSMFAERQMNVPLLSVVENSEETNSHASSNRTQSNTSGEDAINMYETVRFMTTGVGTPGYAAPEVISGQSDYSTPSDIYGLGTILWECYTKSDPFPDYSARTVEFSTLKGERPDIPVNCPLAYANLIRACWTVDPECRPKAHEVIRTLKVLLAMNS